ncbi:MAG: transporter substrate-binding domain-containing protein, partial [Bacteroidales bacterium]|nr:transporter substrate-binding domain-containing protein [Bacteroidales bacterium]
AMVLLPLSCKRAVGPVKGVEMVSTAAKLKKDKTLKVVTEFNSTNYFILRGQPMGFQFEILQDLADHLGVKLEVVPSNDISNNIEQLKHGEVDLVAANLTITKERKEQVDFTLPHLQTRQVLVQKRPGKNSEDNPSTRLIRSQLELSGKTVHVVKNSSYISRLKNLSDEIGYEINIIEVEDNVEKLIQKVASGEIQYTVADEIIARVNKNFYTEIDIVTPISFYQNLAWAVRKNDEEFKTQLNNWLSGYTKSKKYAVLYRKYFKNNRYANILDDGYFTNNTGILSPYDDVLKKYCEEISWDWRLLASMIYQESRFNPQAKSWAGAFGIMQLMPNTARRFGVNQASSVKQQIRAGILLIHWLDERLQDIEDIEERNKFILASYNVGLGHVLDARNIAREFGYDPNIWENHVDQCILKKADPNIYKLPYVKHGYCRGTETYKYVADIVERYKHYANIITQ